VADEVLPLDRVAEAIGRRLAGPRAGTPSPTTPAAVGGRR